ncbi:hypothetical protein F9C07_2224025 [Aspergillus flavus]|uniref:Rhodopsin domain-containing protein n=1 Tax=Aspergillus flavus (strain ATCC 200026 / FGSC A1120 / IAM 13836 / NRRL 3357 / JCM 12722 / SRRC 167) TaxID=332952 RepID=A0A7U2N3F8_ASPFN|nr:hypothetical protein AFLA_009922 [Aspergillus flavus NRRL3357]QRD94847.1 hypothetical protein F9C07_2224025 [Aspergillus flavus]
MISIPPNIVDSWPAPAANPETRGPTLPIIVFTFYTLAGIVLCLRFYAKIRISHAICAEDTLVGLAMLPTTGVTIAVLLSKWEYLLDRHVWDLPPKMYRPSNVLATITFVLFCSASTLVRVSFLVFYRRLIQHLHWRLYIRVIHATILFAIGLYIAYILGLVFRCSPFKAAYDFNPPSFRPSYPHHCASREVLIFSGSTVMTILDFWVMLLPGPIVWQLNLPTKRRIGVLGMFLLGMLICVCGALKSNYIFGLFHTYDEPWVACPIWILSALELHIGILCSSVPSLRVVAREGLRKRHENLACRRGRQNGGSGSSSSDSSLAHTHLKRSILPFPPSTYHCTHSDQLEFSDRSFSDV